MLTIDTISSWFKELQNNITESLSELDGLGKFESDIWQRAEGGGGDTRIILNGNVFLKEAAQQYD